MQRAAFLLVTYRSVSSKCVNSTAKWKIGESTYQTVSSTVATANSAIHRLLLPSQRVRCQRASRSCPMPSSKTAAARCRRAGRPLLPPFQRARCRCASRGCPMPQRSKTAAARCRRAGRPLLPDAARSQRARCRCASRCCPMPLSSTAAGVRCCRAGRPLLPDAARSHHGCNVARDLRVELVVEVPLDRGR